MSDQNDRTEERERLERALTAVRREGQKVAAIYAVVDGVAVLLAVNLGLTVLGVSVPGPPFAREAIAVGLGVVVMVGEFLVRIRRPLVEQFEAANPGVREALRTARDAAAAGAETPVARRLYEDVLDRLGEASGARLVSTGRLVGGVVAVVLLSLATVQVSVAGVGLLGGSDAGAPVADDPDREEYEGLASGDEILGNATSVGEGSDDLDATIGGSGGEATDAPTANESSAYEASGFSPSGSFDTQQAGFAAKDDLENAEIIREYNLKIRGESGA
ncbi:MAG: hypothetical protein ABEH56_07080 [Salinirussus sp.]